MQGRARIEWHDMINSTHTGVKGFYLLSI